MFQVVKDVDEGERVKGEVGDSVHESPAPMDDLTRDLDEAREELLELHLDDLLLHCWMLDEQAIPGFEVPG